MPPERVARSRISHRPSPVDPDREPSFSCFGAREPCKLCTRLLERTSLGVWRHAKRSQWAVYCAEQKPAGGE